MFTVVLLLLLLVLSFRSFGCVFLFFYVSACLRVRLCIYVLLLQFLFCLSYFCVISSSISVSIQVVLFDHKFGVDALTSIFHKVSFKYDDKLARDIGLVMDQSESDRITCVKCKSRNYSFVLPIFDVDVMVVFFCVCFLLCIFSFFPLFSLLLSGNLGF